MMDLKRLKHLVALADCAHFGRAAEQCHLSPSAFSRSIQSLEDELGLQLFVRGTHEVRCTPAGAFVLERARKLLFDSRCMARDLALYRACLVGDLAFGVGPYPAVTLMPGLLTALRQRFGQTQVRVEVNNAKYLMTHLLAEELDFYVADLRHIPPAPHLNLIRLGLLQAGYFVRQGHPLAGQVSITGADVLAYGLACVQLHESLRLHLGPLFGLPLGEPLPLALECDDVNLLKKVALNTDTVLVCPVDGVQEEVGTGVLTPITIEGLPVLGSNLGVVALKDRSFSPLAAYAVEWLKQSGLPPSPA